MKIFDWLKAMDGYGLNESLYSVIGLKRGIEDVTVKEHTEVEKRTLSLMEVDLVWYAMMYEPTGSKSESASDGGWQQTEGQRQISEAERKRKLGWCAMMYDELGDDLYTIFGRVRMKTNPILKHG